ncbi:type II CAAX prenyl endopeptidase Rce1 family protein [Bacillus manliponensis]|uniref:CPBP family glutamic-type intramembrane protease n=1 Tax=Bacillus manliponensis TaxID=574376 RepID=UPI0035139102
MNMAFARIRLRSFFGWMILGVIMTLIPLSIADAGDNAFEFVLQVLIFFAFPLLWLFFKTRKHNVRFTSFFDQPSSYSWKLIFIATAMGMVFAFGISMIQFYILAQLIPDFLVELLTEGDIIDTTSTFSKVLSVISVCIFAPIMEEIIFRGFFLNRMAYKWGIKPAIIVSSLMFGFGHIDVIGAFLFGVIMCLLYIKTKSLWTAIIVHALNNTIVTIIQFSSSGESEAINIKDFQAESNLWIGAILIVISLIWMVPFIRRHWRTVKESGLPSLSLISGEQQESKESIYNRVILTERHMAIELPDEIVNHLQLEENDYVDIQLDGEKIVITKKE